MRGWQVAPAELEAILLTHPSITNAAVIGKPVPEGTGEVPRAYVQLKSYDASSYGVASEEKVTEEEVKQYIQERLARYKWLDGGVRFVDHIPRTASGKVQKAKLRAMDAQEAEMLVLGLGEILKESRPGIARHEQVLAVRESDHNNNVFQTMEKKWNAK